jgi:hypothetical protein
LSKVSCIDHERRTRIDIVSEKVIDHVDAEVKRCPTCAATTKSLFPSDRHGPLQHGDGLKAFVINLVVSQMVALNRVQKLVKSMIGVVIAEATLLKFILRLQPGIGNLEASGHRVDTQCTSDKRRRNFFPGRHKKSLDPCLFVRRYYAQVFTPTAR